MKQRILFVMLLLLPLIATGCWDQKSIWEKSFVIALGLEPSPGDKILLTFLTPGPVGSGGAGAELFTAKAHLIHEGIQRGDLWAGGEIETSELQYLLISRELAGRGMHGLLEAFERDPAQRLQSSLIVVEGSPNRLLKKLRGLKGQNKPLFYLGKLLDRADQAATARISLGDFQIGSSVPGLDPVLPLIKQVPDGIAINGTALCAGDRMVGRLGPEQTTLLLAMMNKLGKKAKLVVHSSLGAEKGAALKKGLMVSITKVRRKLNLNIHDNIPLCRITLEFKGDLLEYEWDHLGDKKCKPHLKKGSRPQLRNRAGR